MLQQAPSPRPPGQPPLSEICSGIRLTDGARALLNDDLEPLVFVRQLFDGALFTDGINVLARLFPKRDGVWWACQSVRQSLTKSTLPRAAEAAVTAAETWVADPSEENRRPLFAAAQTARMDSAAGMVAFAGFASSGSMVPPEYDPVPPAETMTAELVAGSVLMAGVAEDGEGALERFRMFLEQGIGLYESQAG